MKLTTLHEAWDWKKFGKGTGAGLAIGAAALGATNLALSDEDKTQITQRAPVLANVEQSEPVEKSTSKPTSQPTSKPSTQPISDKDSILIKEFGQELPLIKQAAARNGCDGELFTILLAIRKSENGGTHEFGILNPRAKGFDAQAGWAAATIVKNHKRWADKGKPGPFIDYLGSVYCPTVGDNLRPAERLLNKNWVKNVTHWYNRLK